MTLRAPIGDLLEGDRKAEERAIRRARHRLFVSLEEHSKKKHSPRPWVGLGLGTMSALAAALIALFVTAPSESIEGPLQLADGSAARDLVSSDEPVHAGFSDGSAIEVGSMSELRFVHNDAHRVGLALVGEAEFDIRPHGPRLWTIDMGELQVEVVGTQFSLVCSTDLLRVSVSRGAVRISGAIVGTDARLLRAGESAEFPLQTDEPTRTVEEAAETAPENPEPEPIRRIAPAHRELSAWRSLAREGDYRGAFALLEGEAFTAQVERASDATMLFELADTARLSDHPSEAVVSLSRILAEFPNTPRAAIAAFTLGRLYQESLERPFEAARAFEQALALGLPPSLQESAAARRMMLLSRVGQSSRACEAACQYLETHPMGPAAHEARELCEAIEGESR